MSNRRISMVIEKHFRGTLDKNQNTQSRKLAKHKTRLLAPLLAWLVKLGAIGSMVGLGACSPEDQPAQENQYTDVIPVPYFDTYPSSITSPLLTDGAYDIFEDLYSVPYRHLIKDPVQMPPAPQNDMKFYHVEVNSPWLMDTNGSRHGTLATAIFDQTADKIMQQDIDVRMIDNYPFYANLAFRNILSHAGVISISMGIGSAYNFQKMASLWDRSDTFVSAASGNLPESDDCDQNPHSASGMNMFEMADTLTRVGSYNSDTRQIFPFTSCTSSDVIVPQISAMGDFYFVYQMSNEDFRSHLNQYRPHDMSTAEVEEKYHAYANTDIPEKGEFSTGYWGNSFASPWLGALVSAGRTLYPNLAAHEVMIALWTSGNPYGLLTSNGMPVTYTDNGSGLDYDKKHVGFGSVEPNDFFESLSRYSEIKANNPFLEAQLIRKSVSGTVQSSNAAQTVYNFHVGQNLTNIRLILSGHSSNETTAHGFFRAQLTRPDQRRMMLEASNKEHAFNAVTSEAFGTSSAGTWSLTVPANINIQEVSLDIIGVQGGLADVHIAQSVQTKEALKQRTQAQQKSMATSKSGKQKNKGMMVLRPSPAKLQ